jgi:hypothetical protein
LTIGTNQALLSLLERRRCILRMDPIRTGGF